MIIKIFRATICFLLLMSFVVTPVRAQTDADEYITYIQVSLWNPLQSSPDYEDITGFRFNLLYGQNTDLSGFDLGLINNLTGKMTGLQAGLFNIDREKMSGVQIGMDNVVGYIPFLGGNKSSKMDNAEMHGVQFGCINLVFPSGGMHGVQFGLFNIARNARGLQIGLINYSEELTGIQIGLVNYIENAEIFLAPIVNACF